MRIKKVVGLLAAVGMIGGMTLSGAFSTGPSTVGVAAVDKDAMISEVVASTSEVAVYTAETAVEPTAAEQDGDEQTDAGQDGSGQDEAGQTEQIPDDAVIADGISIGDFDVSGMTKAEAVQLVEDYMESMKVRPVVLSISGNQENTSAEVLGFQWTNTNAVDMAAAIGKQGNLISRYKVLKDVETEKLQIPLNMIYNEELVNSFVTESCTKYDFSATNATLTRSGGRFVVTADQVGMESDKIQTAANLLTALQEGKTGDTLTVEATVAELQPARTSAALSQVKDVLGTYTTSFNQGNAGRSMNLAVGTSKINGYVLMPGEIFSGYEAMAPFSSSNGYAAAGAYQNGVVIESVGGGACQIATTLYNAILQAELEVTQRQNHSMIVGYVPYSFDAAIAGTYKDIKFRNNLDYPIYLEGGTSGGNLTFTIYGKEFRPANRTVKYQSVTLSESWPEAPIYSENPNLPAGTEVSEQGAYPAVSSQLWKYIYVDGVQQEKIMIHQDRYSSSPARISVGSGPPLEGEEAGEVGADGEGISEGAGSNSAGTPPEEGTLSPDTPQNPEEVID